MYKYRLGLSVLLFLIALFPLALKPAHAANDIQLMIEGNMYEPDVPPTIVNDRTMVPVAIVAETLGAEVNWNDEEKKVTVHRDSVELTMWIGNPKTIVNNRELVLDSPPQIINDRTFIPLRFIGQALGAHVGWDDATRTVVVNREYILTANRKTINDSVFNLNGQLYLPLESVASNLGAKVQIGQDGHMERFTLNDQTFTLNKDGQQQLQLKKMDIGWMIPVSIVEEFLKATTTIGHDRIDIERLSRLESVREEQDRIFIDFTMPTSPNHFRMASPERLVIDLPNMIIGEPLQSSSNFENGAGVLPKNETVSAAEFQGSLVEEVRFSQFSTDPHTVRVVVELSEKADYELSPTGSGYEITLKASQKTNSDPITESDPVTEPDPIFDVSPEPSPDSDPIFDIGTAPIAPPFVNKDKFVVVLDPGHGGSDPGATGIDGIKEKELTLAVTNYLANELKAYDKIQVIQTRTGDTYPSLQERVELANQSQADVFVSIHANSFTRQETRGTETFYYTSQSKAFANALHKRLVEATGFPDRGLKTSRFYVINHTTMPSALVEIGFMSNPVENAQMQDPVFQQRVAKAMAEAIYEYYSSLSLR